MHTTLDNLEKHNNKKYKTPKSGGLLKELKIFLIIFFFSAIFVLIFTNIELFSKSLSDSLDLSTKTATINRNKKNKEQDGSISTMISYSSERIDNIQQMINKFKTGFFNSIPVSTSTESVLKDKLKNYPFKFNTLPPTNRLIIPSLNLDIPIITSKYKNTDDFSKGDFDSELNEGAVKYPTTPEPGETGNTLIFGHTSQERWKKNPYGTIFANLPKLQVGDEIKAVRKGNLYTYKVVNKVIKYPKEVNEEYMKYNSDSYITIMGCYPLGTTDKRMMVMAKKIN